MAIHPFVKITNGHPPYDGATGKVRGSSKSLGFVDDVQNLVPIHPADVVILQDTVDKNFDLLMALQEQSVYHQGQ